MFLGGIQQDFFVFAFHELFADPVKVFSVVRILLIFKTGSRVVHEFLFSMSVDKQILFPGFDLFRFLNIEFCGADSVDSAACKDLSQRALLCIGGKSGIDIDDAHQTALCRRFRSLILCIKIAFRRPSEKLESGSSGGCDDFRSIHFFGKTLSRFRQNKIRRAESLPEDKNVAGIVFFEKLSGVKSPFTVLKRCFHQPEVIRRDGAEVQNGLSVFIENGARFVVADQLFPQHVGFPAGKREGEKQHCGQESRFHSFHNNSFLWVVLFNRRRLR